MCILLEYKEVTDFKNSQCGKLPIKLVDTCMCVFRSRHQHPVYSYFLLHSGKIIFLNYCAGSQARNNEFRFSRLKFQYHSRPEHFIF